jgi:hypothetical protein
MGSGFNPFALSTDSLQTERKPIHSKPQRNGDAPIAQENGSTTNMSEVLVGATPPLAPMTCRSEGIQFVRK